MPSVPKLHSRTCATVRWMTLTLLCDKPQRPLHGQFRLQALQIARDGRDGKRTIATPVGDGAVPCGQRAVDIDGIPVLGMTDVVDRGVVMLTPEERDRIVSLAMAQDVPCRDLALPL